MRLDHAQEAQTKVGICVNTQFLKGDNVAARVPELVEQLRVAQRSGFASLLFPRHYLRDLLQMLQIAPLMAYLLPEAKSWPQWCHGGMPGGAGFQVKVLCRLGDGRPDREWGICGDGARSLHYRR